jgi:four helix bundle protein
MDLPVESDFEEFVAKTMSKIERFEDLDCWKAARVLVSSTYKLTYEGPVTRDFNFIDQVRSAALSVMSNIAEGFGGSDKSFISFLRIADRSGQEVSSLSHAAMDLMYWSEEESIRTRERVDTARRLIRGLIRYLQQKGRTK